MVIVSQQVEDFVSHFSAFQARFEYEFDEGPKHLTSHMRVASRADADDRLIELAPSILRKRLKSGAKERYRQDGSIDNTVTARTYILSAVMEEPAIAYRRIKRFRDYVQANGWTPEQARAQVEITEGDWLRMTTLFTYLNSNTQLLQDYETFFQGVPK